MKRFLLSVLAISFAFILNAQILSEDFESTPGELPSGWLTVTPTYASFATNWHPNTYNDNDCMRASSFSGTNHATEQWLVTPSFSLAGQTTISFSFDNEKANYPGNPMQVFISSDFAGDSASFASATWDEITGLNLSTGTYEWVTSTHDISAYAGEASVYIAFKYTSTDTEGAVWDVDNIVVSAGSNVASVNSGIRISPNPTNANLNINSVSNIDQIAISNIIGQRVLNINNVNSKNFTLDVRNLKSGVYMIAIRNNNGTVNLSKFVKE